MKKSYVSIFIFLASLLPFLPTLHSDWLNYDDTHNFLENYYFRGINVHTFVWAWKAHLLGVYQPLSWLQFSLEYALFDLNPMGYHLVSLAWHGLNSVLLYLLFLRLKVVDSIALLITLLFAIHPLRTEVVAWLSCQPYLPSIFFSILSLHCHLFSLELPQKRWKILALTCFLIALLFKSIAITLPFLMLFIELHLNRIALKKGLLKKWPYLILMMLFCVIALFSKSHTDILESTRDSGVWPRIAQFGYSSIYLVIKSFIPIHLYPFYPLPEGKGWVDTPLLAYVFLSYLFIFMAYLYRQRMPLLFHSILIYLAMLLPNSGLIKAANAMTADRYSYFATLPLFIAGASFIRPTQKMRALLFLCVLIFSCLSFQQSKRWVDSVVLWKWTVKNVPNHRDALNNLGDALQLTGHLEEAKTVLEKCISLYPNFPYPHDGLGMVYWKLGETEKALDAFGRALIYYPDFYEATTHIAQLLIQVGQPEEAELHLMDLLSKRPTLILPRMELLRLLENQERWDEAKPHRHFLSTHLPASSGFPH